MVLYFFSYFCVPINCSSWVCKLHNIFLACAENEEISIFGGFLVLSFMKVQFQLIDIC